MNLTLQNWGPWALITGASTGLGLEFANQLAAGGLKLLLVAHNPERIQAAAEAIQKRWGGEVRWLSLDLGQPDAVDHLAAWVGDLDVGVIISNAGAGNPAAFLDRSESDHARTFQLNGQTHAQIAHRFGPKLRARGRGGILFVAAMGAQHGIPSMASDAAAKALVISLGRALNHEWRGAGVHVSVLSPGPTQTPVIQKLGFDGLSLPMKPASAIQCVREGLTALRRNRAHWVSGWLFRWVSRVLPPAAWTAMNGTMLGQAARVVAGRRAKTVI